MVRGHVWGQENDALCFRLFQYRIRFPPVERSGVPQRDPIFLARKKRKRYVRLNKCYLFTKPERPVLNNIVLDVLTTTMPRTLAITRDYTTDQIHAHVVPAHMEIQTVLCDLENRHAALTTAYFNDIPNGNQYKRND